MPRKGWKSLTVPDYVYNFFEKEWKKTDKEWRLKHGIRSLSAYIAAKLYDLIEQEKKKEEKSDTPQ